MYVYIYTYDINIQSTTIIIYNLATVSTADLAKMGKKFGKEDLKKLCDQNAFIIKTTFWFLLTLLLLLLCNEINNTLCLLLLLRLIHISQLSFLVYINKCINIHKYIQK